MAYFSQDPNIGIRQAGMGAFIPPAINSLSYKGNAGVNAQRKAARGNTKKPKTVIEGVTPGTFGPPSSLANPDSKPSKTFVPRDLVKRMPAPGILMANAPGTGAPVKPTTTVGGVRMSRLADGIVKNQELDDESLATSMALDSSKRPLNLNGIDPEDFIKGRAAARGKKPSFQLGGTLDSTSQTFGNNTGMRST
jgi:hypothetical protein